MLNFASKMINTLIGAPGEEGQQQPGQQQQSMMMRNPQMGGQRPGMFQQQGQQQQQQMRPAFPGQQQPGQQQPRPPPGSGPGFMGPRPPGGGPGGRPPGPPGPGGPGGPPPGMGPQRFGGPPGPGLRANGPRGPPGANPRMMQGGPGGPPRGPPGMGPRGGPPGPMGPPGGPGGGPGGRFYPPNRPPPGQGPGGPQGPLRGPYPGSSPPGQQMRGPMMANNAGQRPPYFGGPNQGPPRGPAGMIRPGFGPQQQQQQGMMPGQQQQPTGGSPFQAGTSAANAPGAFPDVDMSHLSEEERMLIESVMAKAQMEELDASVKPTAPNPRMAKGQLARQISQPETMERENELRYSIDPSGNGINRRTSMSVTDMSNLAAINNQQQQHLLQQRLCSVCCRRDITGRDGPPGQPCAECRSVVCTTCGGYGASSYDNKSTVWLCRTCLDRRQNLNWPQQQQPGLTNNQQTQMMRSSMNDVSNSGLDANGRPIQQTMKGSGMTVYNEHMATANALRIGSPTGVGSNPAYRTGTSSVGGAASATSLNMLRPQRSLDAVLDPSTGLPSSTSSPAGSSLSHFGPSAIRFRSAQHHGTDATFKDERMPLSPTTGMAATAANHSVMSSAMAMSGNRMNDSNSLLQQQQQQQQQLHHQQQQQQLQQQYNNDIHSDPFQQHQQHQQGQQQQTGAKPAGTITGMLADFSRALGLGSNAARSSPSDQAFGADPNQSHLQQQQHATLNTAQNQQQQHQMQLQQQHQLQQQQQQQLMQQNPQQQMQQQNLFFSADGTAANTTAGLMTAQTSLNPFTGQQQQQLPGQPGTMQPLMQQQQIQGQPMQTGNFVTNVFPNNAALSQMDPQQQQQHMALQQQQQQHQQQLQLQQQQQLGQVVSNNQMLVGDNMGSFQTNQQLQQKPLTQINALPNQTQQQQQQQQPYGIPGTQNYVHQVAQQFEQSGVAAVIASQQPMNMTGLEHQHLYANHPQQSPYPAPGTLPGAVSIDGAMAQHQRPLTQQAALVQQQQQQQQAQLANQQQLLNDPNRIGMFNPQTGLATTAGQAAQQQQTLQQQQMMQQAAVQLQQQQSIIQQQQQQLMMMNSTNQEYMQMQHQAQHSKKLRKMAGQNTVLEQQQLMANKMNPQVVRKNMLTQQQQQQQQAPAAALLHQSSIVPDPNKTAHATGDVYGTGSMLRSADLLHKSRIRLIDGRPYSPTASPEIDLLGMRPGPAAHSFIIGGTPITTPMGTPAGTPRGGHSSRDRDMLACDSPDTLSETDSQASLRLRRKLPLLPPDQEAALLPSVQKKKLELAKSQQQQQQQQQQQLASVQDRIKAYSNLRQGSMTETASSAADKILNSSTTAGTLGGLTRPTSETNLRQLAYGDPIATSLAARPGSALGLLQGSSIVNANGLRSSINLTNSTTRSNPTINVKSEEQTFRESLAAILPPDLRHLVGAPSTGPAGTTTGTTSDSNAILSVSGIRTAALEDLRGSPLTRRRALEEELQRLTEDRARLRSQTDKDRERELRIRRELEKFAALRDPMKRFDPQRRPGSAAAGLIGASSSSNVSSRLRKGRGHRRQMSDPRVSSLMRDREESTDRYSTTRSQSMNRAKAYEYESLEELNSASSISGITNKADWDRHRSIPTSYSGSALNRLLTEDDDFLSRKYTNRRSNMRRSSDGGMTMTDYLMDPSLLTGSHLQTSQSSRSRYNDPTRMLSRGLSYDVADRSGLTGAHHLNSAHSNKSILLSRKPRSWHPSPYGSDEEFMDAEDDILTREAKKQRIKAEIARRRQQIEQNSRLHDELLRLARLRESGDVNAYQTNHGLVSGSTSMYGGNARLAAANNSSVLRSINDILREDRDYSGRSRSAAGGHLYDYSNASPTRRYMAYGSHSRGASPARNYSGVPSEEERSMERLASTFRTEDYTSSLYERLHDFSPLASDPELGGCVDYGTAPTAMPLLPDMPSRSRKLLEDLAASANDAPTMHIQSRGKYGAGAHSTSRYLSPR